MWKSGAPLCAGPDRTAQTGACAHTAERPEADWCKFKFSPRVVPFGGAALRDIPIWSEFTTAVTFLVHHIKSGEVRIQKELVMKLWCYY